MEYSRMICFILLSIFHNSFLNSETEALPVTSKPIENSVENLAWQAWLMLPTEQKNLEKTRKVTPKSIFTLPLRDCPIGYKQIETACNNNCAPSQISQIRCISTCPNGYKEINLKCVLDCPPGHKVFDFRCISLFNIDQDNLLAQELGLLAGNIENSYDYEDEEMLVYDNSQPFSDGISMGYTYESETQLPTKDEPLKFNIFEQKFPTDYTEYGVDLTAKKEVSLILNKEMDTSLVDLKETPNETNQTQPFNKNSDPQSMNSTASLNVSTLNPEEYFSLGSVDAIALPASDVAALPDRFSLYKNENLMHAIPSPLNKSKNYQDFVESNTDLTHLMLIDDLLPVNTTSFESSVWQPSDSELIANKSFTNAENGKVTTTFTEDTEDSITLTPSTYIDKINSTFDLKSNFSESNKREMIQRTRDMDMGNEDHVKITHSEGIQKFGATLEIEKSKRQDIDGHTIEEKFNGPEENVDPANFNVSLLPHLLNKKDLNELQSQSSIGNETLNYNKTVLNVTKPTGLINEPVDFGQQLQIINTLVKDKRTIDSSYAFSASISNSSTPEYENNISKSSQSDEKEKNNTTLVNSTSLEINKASKTNSSIRMNSNENIAESSKFTTPMNFLISSLRSPPNTDSSSESFLASSSIETSKQVLIDLNRTEFEKPNQYPINQSTTKKSVQGELTLQQESNSNRFLSLETKESNMTETSTPSFEPFWWLPFGWSLDRKSIQNENQEINIQNSTSQGLVFGLWSKLTSNDKSITSQNTQKAAKSFIDENAS